MAVAAGLSSSRGRPRWSQFVDPKTVPDGELPSVAELGNSLLGQARQVGPPVDLASVLELWPGLKVSVEDLDGTGYLLDLGFAGGEIILRSDNSRARRRFTLVHELGHWLLGPEGAVVERSHRDSQMERWCDRLAAEVLMPSAWISRDLKGPVEGLAKRVAGLPQTYGVSLAAALLRASEACELGIAFKQFMDNGNGRTAEYFRKDWPPRLKSQLCRLVDNRRASLERYQARAGVIDLGSQLASYYLSETRHRLVVVGVRK